jgi:hypothetical protein
LREIAGTLREIMGTLREITGTLREITGTLREITGALREHQYTFLLCQSFLLGMINVSVKSRRENQNTHFMFNNFLPKIVPFLR